MLADPALRDLLHRRPRAPPLPAAHAPIASGWSNSCRVGQLPPTGSTCPFHGARILRVRNALGGIIFPLDFSFHSISCPMRLAPFLIIAVFAAGSLFADEVPIDQLPRVVLETVEMEKGDGIAKSADSYTWANTTIYKIEIDVDGAPELELHVAENGKLIRIDRLQAEMDNDDRE